jgi:hypothetical protein
MKSTVGASQQRPTTSIASAASRRLERRHKPLGDLASAGAALGPRRSFSSSSGPRHASRRPLLARPADTSEPTDLTAQASSRPDSRPPARSTHADAERHARRALWDRLRYTKAPTGGPDGAFCDHDGRSCVITSAWT